MEKRKVILVTDGDKIARKALEEVARQTGGRCISRSGGNPTPLSGEQLVELIRQAASDPVLVMFDDCGSPGTGDGERALRHVARDPHVEVLGAIAVASDLKVEEGVRVDAAIDREGRVIHRAVDKHGVELAQEPPLIHGDTVAVLNELDIPFIVGIGDVGKMGERDSVELGAPVTAKAVRMILKHHGLL
ncbi:stage V sporulation protein AE [Staphylospora marina]|uniref:stage V sporulation protein AE n=1 Tax=Staphylospora marina TaxID=2490858 RepID=UPI000F5BA110|nr:stage V sporulation protein AE [Staphylospora marina]